MPQNRITIDPDGDPDVGIGGTNNLDETVTKVGLTEPKIAAADDDVNLELKPPVTTKVDATLNWSSQSNQTLCGETLVATAGDQNMRVVLEGLVYYHQLDTLKEMREKVNELLVITPLSKKMGPATVKPDKLKIKRSDEQDTVTTESHPDIEGTVEEPLYTFQFQKKENDDDGIFDFGDN